MRETDRGSDTGVGRVAENPIDEADAEIEEGWPEHPGPIAAVDGARPGARGPANPGAATAAVIARVTADRLA